MKIYSVINMDLVKSRELKNREEIQLKLEGYFVKINFKYNKILVAPITFTLGDEWQIVIRDVKESYNLYTEIKRFLELNNVKAYCGIGIGRISTNEANDTRKMDGEAFIYARDAINMAKKSNTFYNKVNFAKECKVIVLGKKANIYEGVGLNTNYDNLILAECAATTEDDGDGFTLLDVINNTIQNNEIIESRFTEKQKKIIELYEECGSYSNIEKNYPEYNKSSISNKLSAANYFLTLYNKRTIVELLSSYEKKLEDITYKEESLIHIQGDRYGS